MSKVYTFAETAELARTVEPSQPLGAINYCRMIAELAEALDRFEHNVARMLTYSEPRRTELANATRAFQETLTALRSEIPAHEKPQGDTPQ